MTTDPKPLRRPRTPTVDVSEELLTAMQEAADIFTGKLAPSRVWTPESIARAAEWTARRKAPGRR